jgi:hypothetical protein
MSDYPAHCAQTCLAGPGISYSYPSMPDPAGQVRLVVTGATGVANVTAVRVSPRRSRLDKAAPHGGPRIAV